MWMYVLQISSASAVFIMHQVAEQSFRCMGSYQMNWLWNHQRCADSELRWHHVVSNCFIFWWKNTKKMKKKTNNTAWWVQTAVCRLVVSLYSCLNPNCFRHMTQWTHGAGNWLILVFIVSCVWILELGELLAFLAWKLERVLGLGAAWPADQWSDQSSSR